MYNSIEQLQPFIDDYLAGRGRVKILEAGCGSMSRISFGDNKHVVGIDISEKQLQRNSALDEVLCGDIQSFAFPKQAFDIIVCWDVLEHLETPEKAIENFFVTCKPGGLIILAFPNIYSLKGVVAKLAPHSIHVWYYKFFLGIPDAGEEEQAPFRTFLKYSMSYPAVHRSAREHNASVDLFILRESHDMQFVRRKFSIVDRLIGAASWVSKIVTGGKIDAADSDCIVILRTAPEVHAGAYEAAADVKFVQEGARAGRPDKVASA